MVEALIRIFNLQVGFAQVREVQDLNPDAATIPLAGGGHDHPNREQAEVMLDGQQGLADPGKDLDWECQVTGWKMSDPGVEIQPLGTLHADHIISGAGLSMWSKATERFLMCVPMQARHFSQL